MRTSRSTLSTEPTAQPPPCRYTTDPCAPAGTYSRARRCPMTRSIATGGPPSGPALSSCSRRIVATSASPATGCASSATTWGSSSGEGGIPEGHFDALGDALARVADLRVQQRRLAVRDVAVGQPDAQHARHLHPAVAQ